MDIKENSLNKYDPGAHELLLIHNFSEIKWIEEGGQKGSGVSAMPKGVKKCILVGDPNKEGLCVMRLYYPPHFKVPPHVHPMAEHSCVMEGTCYAGFNTTVYDESKIQKFTAGAWFSTPVNMPHFAGTNEEHCIIEFHVMGPWGIHYCNQDDHPANG